MQMNNKKNIKKKNNCKSSKKKINNIQKKKKGTKKKHFRIKFKFLFIFLLILLLIALFIYYINKIRITNIYISGNTYLHDQQIIELANIDNYPETFKNSSSNLEKKLEENIYIKKAIVKKKYFTQIYITIEENRPLFYNQSINKTILLNKKTTTDKFNTPILINNIPNNMSDEFIEKISQLDIDVLNKINEIKYNPDEVDDERFLFSMTDSNYVYLTLNSLEKINDYNEIVKQFDNKKGILYLNSGGYFEIK